MKKNVFWIFKYKNILFKNKKMNFTVKIYMICLKFRGHKYKNKKLNK